MAWRDTLRPASFRGVPFEVEGHDVAFGRRNVATEYPHRDEPWTEDLGRRGRVYRVQAFVIGADYHVRRDDLVRALEAAGPGQLVHPYLGTMVVSVGGAQMGESPDEGGMATFSIEFLETGANVAPQVTVDTQAQSLAAASVAVDGSLAGFVDGYDMTGAPSFVTDALASSIDTGVGAMVQTAGGLGAPASAMHKVQFNAKAVIGTRVSLTRKPLALGKSILSLSSTMGAIATDARRALGSFSSLATTSLALPAALGVTPARALQRKVQDKLSSLIHQAGAIEAVRAATAMTFRTFDEAIGVRDDLAQLLDGLALRAGDAGDDQSYQAMDGLRLAMMRDLNARGASLARLTTVTPPATTPALVLAHRLYGDVGRESDIIAGGPGGHPGFIAGGQSIRTPSRV